MTHPNARPDETSQTNGTSTASAGAQTRTPSRAPRPRARPSEAAIRNTVARPLPGDTGIPTHFLVNVDVKDTKDPAVSRMLAVPNTFTFRHFERALSTAFAYKTTSGMFEVTSPAWIPGRGRPPRRNLVHIFNDVEQRNRWHKWDDENDVEADERMIDELSLRSLLEELGSCGITYLVGTWAHEIEIMGAFSLALRPLGTSPGHAVCISGEGHPVLESSDSTMWHAFKEAYRTTAPTAQQKQYRVWYEQEAAGGDARGLALGGAWRWEKDNVNRELSLLPAAPFPSAPAPHAEPMDTSSGHTAGGTVNNETARTDGDGEPETSQQSNNLQEPSRQQASHSPAQGQQQAAQGPSRTPQPSQSSYPPPPQNIQQMPQQRPYYQQQPGNHYGSSTSGGQMMYDTHGSPYMPAQNMQGVRFA